MAPGMGMGGFGMGPGGGGAGAAGGGYGYGYGQAYKNLGYDYAPPTLGYSAQPAWGAWDLANAQYNGGRLERSFFDNIVRLCREYENLKVKNSYLRGRHPFDPPPTPPSPLRTPFRHGHDLSLNPPGERNLVPSKTIQQISGLTNFFANRHLSEEAAKDAHRRVYYQGDGADAGNKTLGGAAAYQAYLIWDRDHYSAYHASPSQENRERLVGLAVAELFSLWDRVQPRSTRANPEDAAQYAAATAKYLFDRHYELPYSNGFFRGSNRHPGYREDSDSEDEHRHRRRSLFGQQPFGGGMGQGMMGGPGMGGMGPGMMGGGMAPGMGMSQPGMGAMGMPGGMGMPGAMGNGGMGMPGMMGGMGAPMGMNGMMGGMGMNGMNGMGMNQAMMGLQQGVPPHGSIGEMQAAPGMHPYHYGAQSGVSWGNQPIDQMGNPTFPGGPQRSWYAYGQPRYF
nr:hypothetical protein L204_05601 [Cryptococcus depauperatus CBS 7855]